MPTITIDTIRRGVKSGILLTWELAQIVVPVYFLVTILKHTPVLPWISDRMVPVMSIVGLPGEASLVLVLGYTVNIYSAIAAMLPLNLNVDQITILAAMILVAHSLPVEMAIIKKTGVRILSLLLIRIGVSFGLGIIFNLLA
ncbi:MAG: nucleoside recognition domain-containing protein [Syntrophomonadaceae bacterium]